MLQSVLVALIETKNSSISMAFQHSYFFFRRRSTLIANGSHFLLPPSQSNQRRCCESNVALSAARPQFFPGDEVELASEDDVTHIVGVVESKRGGWYTVRCVKDAGAADGDSSVIVKRRGSQLQKRSSRLDGDSQSTLKAGVIRNYRTKDIDETQQIQEPSVSILDLDFMLQKFLKHGKMDPCEPQESLHQIMNCHSQYNRWLIFSDLHVMPSTLPTCLEVLNFIHHSATKRNAGVVFLGDFWHHRGFINTICLNAILEAMSRWTIPCIMIPGNHDQVDWRGVEHALSPLGNSYRIYPPNENSGIHTKQYPGPLVLSRPTKFMDAVFVPHTRDKSMMKSILSSKEAAASSALFVHADVKGASMNDLITSQNGISASNFPSNKHVYSGHFHKPHVVHASKSENSLSSHDISVRYVGSPYQTSFAEAGQAKSLLLVDSQKNWECIEEIPIDIGSRYHRIATMDQFLDPGNIHDFRRGDKVAVTVCQQDLVKTRVQAEMPKERNGEKPTFDTKLEELRDAGITVEIRDGQPQSQEEMAATSQIIGKKENFLEDLSPEATLVAYLDSEVENGEIDQATAKLLLEKGKDTVRESSNDESYKGDASSSLNSPLREVRVTELQLDSVSLVGFGSFRRKAVYPLRKRGVVLLRGTNKDFGSDSNGVGKSSLAMASLWALTGSTDPRLTQDGKVTDIVNDFSTVAEVTLSGSINSKSFTVKRTKGTSSKSSSLTFVLDNSDLTRQSSKDTQALINEHFNIKSQILPRTIFMGQHMVGGLLESSDAKLKEELSYLLSLDLWQHSASLSRSKQRRLLQKCSELEGMLSLRGADLHRAEEVSRIAKTEMKKQELILENERAALRQREESIAIHSDLSDIEKDMESVQTQLHDCESKINGLEEELSKYLNMCDLNLLRSKVNKKIQAENESRGIFQDCQRKLDVTTMELTSAERELDKLQSEWVASTKVEDESSHSGTTKNCPTCGQPITSLATRKHMTANVEEKLHAAMSHVDKLKESVSVGTLKREEAKEDTDSKELEAQSCLQRLRQEEYTLSNKTDGLRNKIKTSRLIHSKLSAEFSNLATKAKEISQCNLIKAQAQAKLNSLNDALDSSVDIYNNRCSEVRTIKANIAEFKEKKETTTKEASCNALLADIFGPKGIQAFVLRDTVQSLQDCSQAFLDELSDGSLHLRMKIGSNDNIIKQPAIRNCDGTWRQRSLSSLSGGQWRRCSLSLSLGFVDLASKRGTIRSSLLVLDEPLTHLDSAGRKSIGKLLRKMLIRDDTSNSGGRVGCSLSTILVILQEIAAEEIEECFDQIDEVVKEKGESFLVLDKNREESLR